MVKSGGRQDRGLVLVGGGGHCRACIDVIEQAGEHVIAGIVDPALAMGEEVLGYPVLGDDAMIPELVRHGYDFLITVGQIRDPSRRRGLFERIAALGGRLPVIVSPLAHVSPHTRIGAGTVVMHHAVINAGAVVGRNCIVNTRALVEHDVVVHDHCHVATGAILNGGVVVEEGVFVGSGAVCREGVRLGRESVVGCGVAVLHDVAAGRCLAGNRGREDRPVGGR